MKTLIIIILTLLTPVVLGLVILFSLSGLCVLYGWEEV